MSTDSATVHADDRVPHGHDHAAAAASGPSPRASDAERADVVAQLHAALGAGRLDLAETDERVAAAYAARHRHELAALLTDLPHDDVVFTDPPSWTALWTLLVWCARTAVTGTVGPRPTPAQHRNAARLIALAVIWVVLCAVAGALAVGA
jgi:Domain of unknown function (DUF1707)